MKNVTKVFMLLLMSAVLCFTSCVTSQSPAERYAKEHESKEFKGFDDLNKKLDKELKKEVKDHNKNNQ